MPKTARRETVAEANVRLVTKAILSAREMTGAQLAEALAMSADQAYNRLKGVKPFTVDEVYRMADRFSVPVEMFFRGPDALFGTSKRPAHLLRSDGDNGIYLRVRNVDATPLTCGVSRSARGYSHSACTCWTQSQPLRFSLGRSKIRTSSCCSTERWPPRLVAHVMTDERA